MGVRNFGMDRPGAPLENDCDGDQSILQRKEDDASSSSSPEGAALSIANDHYSHEICRYIKLVGGAK